MASPLTHMVVGYALFRTALPRFPELAIGKKAILLLAAAVVGAMLADADAVAGVIHHDLGTYHNQFSHSLGMAVAAGLAAGLAGRLITGFGLGRWITLGLAAYLSHVLIDFATLGRGVQLFWPLTNQRYTSPVPLFCGLHWSEGLWSVDHLITLANEIPIMAAMLWLTHRQGSRRALADDRLKG